MTTAAMPNLLDSVKFDAEGFMVDAKAWTPAIAEALAAREALVLTPRHWVVINFDRAVFEGAIREYQQRERRFGGLAAKTTATTAAKIGS